MSNFGYDENGLFKILPDGRVLRVNERMFNTLLTLSMSRQDRGWRDGW
jgi:hypothetical protein